MLSLHPIVGGVKEKKNKEEEEKKKSIWRLTLLQGDVGKKYEIKLQNK